MEVLGVDDFETLFSIEPPQVAGRRPRGPNSGRPRNAEKGGTNAKQRAGVA